MLVIAILVGTVILIFGAFHQTTEDIIRERAEDFAYNLSDKELEMMIEELVKIKEERER